MDVSTQEIWDSIQAAARKGGNVIGVISGTVKGGFSVDITGIPMFIPDMPADVCKYLLVSTSIRAFLPGSHADVRPVPIQDDHLLMGKELELRVIKAEQQRSGFNVVVSGKAAKKKAMSERRSLLLANLQEGQVVMGTVRKMTHYGAFVDLGGIDGLLHMNDMSWKRVSNPSEIVSVGDEVKVKVLKFDHERKRISLGMKQLEADPWTSIAERCHVGDRISVRVSKVTDYGCFVEVENGVQGIVHQSDMDWTDRKINPFSVVSFGETIEVQVLSVDVEKRRISLGLKQLRPNPWEEFDASHKRGDRVSGIVKSVVRYGIFIVLDSGVVGLVHPSDISWTEPGEVAKNKYQEGDRVEVVVLNVRADKERITLGIKQLEESPSGDWQP
ncbi:MAG: S1 RNA-binding domain-containing protein [Succinivibrionaceae bacterium]|nr:S1 RNA-binding domain-containing protein [Succinivibrionaceae bacterium]